MFDSRHLSRTRIPREWDNGFVSITVQSSTIVMPLATVDSGALEASERKLNKFTDAEVDDGAACISVMLSIT